MWVAYSAAWRVLVLEMKEATSRDEGWLLIYCIKSRTADNGWFPSWRGSARFSP